MEFAVKVKGVENAQWVVAIDPVENQFLIVHGDKSFHWHAIADCTFVKGTTPDHPQLVMVVEPQQPLSISKAEILRGNGPH